MSDILFVYGTLKVGESRGNLFQSEINGKYKIEKATIKAKLYDLGPYPAIVVGNDIVYGEAVILQEGLLDKMLPILDRIEGFYGENNPHNLYDRVTTKAYGEGEQTDVITYMFSKPSILDTYARHLPEGVWTSC